MSAPHWQSGKYVFPSQDGTGFESLCFESIDDAADHVERQIVEWVRHVYDEWDLGIDGVTPLRHAVQYAERAEQEWGHLEDGSEDPAQWLLEEREARVGDWFVAACGGGPIGPCNVHPAEEQ